MASAAEKLTDSIEFISSSVPQAAGRWHRTPIRTAANEAVAVSEDWSTALPVPDQEYWHNLMLQTFAGCKRAYGAFLSEVDKWLVTYLNKIDFAGDKEGLIIDVLQAVHDKIGTYDPSKSVLGWLLAVVDYKISIASKSQAFANDSVH